MVRYLMVFFGSFAGQEVNVSKRELIGVDYGDLGIEIFCSFEMLSCRLFPDLCFACYICAEQTGNGGFILFLLQPSKGYLMFAEIYTITKKIEFVIY
ncbi:hypothetical protein VNO77_01723 [Canavalia gladiata]|uniref:Uncharacterized protein n=1 Tax=Canavalia gladiata TaxID=3824 RepID=A0AAN9MWK4_CANGL